MNNLTNEDNMALWNSVCKTDPDKTKIVTFGRMKYTTICAQYRIKNATRVWGVYGSTWGLRDIEDTYIDSMCVKKAVFYYPGGSFEINNAIEFKTHKKDKSDNLMYNKQGDPIWEMDADFQKKLETDTLTKSLSKCGFNADVYEGSFDDQRYVDELRKENYERDKYLEIDQQTQQIIEYYNNCLDDNLNVKDNDSLISFYDLWGLLDYDRQTNIFNNKRVIKNGITLHKKKIVTMNKNIQHLINDYVDSVQSNIRDNTSIKETITELSEIELIKKCVWSRLSDSEKKYISDELNEE